MVEKGTVLAAAHAYYTKERATRFLFSEPYLDSKIVLCVLKGSPIKWSGSLKELEGFRIGVVSGFSNTPEFDSDSHLTKDYATNDLYNLKKLIKKRVDVIVIDKYVAIDILKNNPTVDKGLGAVEFLNPELAVRPLHLIFNQTKPKAVELLKNFNEGLRIATEDGSIKEIMQQFE